MRVFVTGVGMVSPLGIGAEHNWQRMLNGETNIHPIPSDWYNFSNFTSHYYSPLPDFDFSELHFTRNEITQKDPATLLANLSSHEALVNAEFDLEQISKKNNQYKVNATDEQRLGIAFGTAAGGLDSYLANIGLHVFGNVKKEVLRLSNNNSEIESCLNSLQFAKRFSPFTVSKVITNTIAAATGIKYSTKGPVRSVTQACSSGTTAIVQGWELIQSGAADLVIAGGAECYNDAYGAVMRSFDVAGALTKAKAGSPVDKINQPFDENRNGFLFSQGGSGTLILESEAHLEHRKVRPLAELKACMETFDAHSIMIPDPEGAQIERLIKSVIANAKLEPENIDYVNTHGTSTIANDKTESEILDKIFGKNAALNSTKSLLGHTFGACGAIEAIVSALSIRDQELHPSLNLENPIADLDFVTERRKQKVDHVLSHSFAFGGHNSGIILGKV